jgi:hypothetical protein
MIPVESDAPPGAVCVITGELGRYSMFHQDLAMLRVPGGTQLTWTCGPLIAANMNESFRKALVYPEGHPRAGEPTALEWVWIMGDDHTFAPDVLLRLLAQQRALGADVLLPGCLNRTPPCAFIIIDESNGRHRDFDKVPRTPFRLEGFEVCGDAGMLLSRRALERLGPPWYAELISGSKTSEDRYFSRKIRDAGFDVWVDPGITLGHITPCVIEPVWDEAEGGWLVRFSVGRTPLVQFRPMPEAAAEPEPEAALA